MELIGFRFEFSKELGGGHFRRCHTLSQKLLDKKAVFFIRGVKADIDRAVDGMNLEYRVIPESCSYQEELKLLSSDLELVSVLFFDVANIFTYSHISTFRAYLKEIRCKVPRVAVIDGMGEDSIIALFPDLNCDFLITPYVGASSIQGSYEHLYGPDYFVLSLNESLASIESRNISQIGRKILITMGQSDPTRISELVLGSLVGIDFAKGNDFEVRVIVGPMMGKDRFYDLTRLAARAPDRVKIIEAPASMVEHYLWCDLTIASTGLTKYELAFTGTPAILISLNDKMARVHKPYESAGVSEHLGSATRLSTQGIYDSVNALAQDKSRRTRFSVQGRRLIDGKGAERLLNRVLEGMGT